MASGTELAKAYIQITPSFKGLQTSINNEMGGVGESSGSSVGSSFVSAFKKIIVAAGIGKAIQQSITEGAALEQSMGGIETLFKESASKVQQNAINAYKTAGLSANAYMEQTTSFAASLLSSLGNDTAKAADVADMAMTDMSDNANKMGTDMESITNAYQGFAKQNYTMLDNLKLGYGGTKSEMERLLADAEKISGTKYDISNLSDVYSAIHVIQGELGITGTTAAEAEGTISGSFNMMKASATNFLAALTGVKDGSGQAVLSVQDSMNNLINSAVSFAGNVIPAIGSVLTSLPTALVQAIQTYGPQAVTAGTEMVNNIANGLTTGIPAMTAKAMELITNFSTYLAANAPTMIAAGVNLVSNLITGFMQAIPTLTAQIPTILSNFTTVGIELINQIATGLTTGIPNLLAQVLPMVTSITGSLRENAALLVNAGMELLLNLAQGIADSLPTLIESIPQIVINIAGIINDNMPTILATGVKILVTLAAGIINAIPTLVANLPQIFTAAASALQAMNWMSVGKNLLNLLVNGIKALSSLPGQVLKGIFNTAKEFITSGFNWGTVGSNIISGIASGLSAAGGMLWDTVKGILGSFKDNVLSFFGIHSPSRWGIWVGKMIDTGLANGVSQNGQLVDSAVSEITDSVTKPFDSVLNGNIATTQAVTYESTMDSQINKIERLLSAYLPQDRNVYIDSTKVSKATYKSDRTVSSRMTSLNNLIMGAI